MTAFWFIRRSDLLKRIFQFQQSLLKERMKRFCFQFLLGSFLCFETSSFAQIPPINDDFENRIFLTGTSVTLTGTLANATMQSSEPVPPVGSAYDASVWWTWTPNQSGAVILEALNFSTNDLKLGGLSVWTGTDFTNFNRIAKTSLDSGRHPFVTFSANLGTAYHLQIMGKNYGTLMLKITETNAPIIIVQPTNRTILTNGSVFFGIVAAGTTPLSYQWRFNGTDLPGETFPILSFDHLETNQSGAYSVAVSNSFAETISDNAILNVAPTLTVPRLLATGTAEGRFSFKIEGDASAIYRVQSSTNLFDWSEEKSFPADFVYYRTREKNGVVYNAGDSFYLPQQASEKFYRAMIYFAPNEICINNLAKIRFAQEIWTLENGGSGQSAIISDDDDFGSYFKNGFPVCPLGPPDCVPCSYATLTADRNPLCKISLEHVLEEPEF
jgi:hypothetical protein